jgi:hypothetical protein
MTDLQSRKDFHNAEVTMGQHLEACPSCKRPNAMIPGSIPDPANDEVYYFAKCRFCNYKDE